MFLSKTRIIATVLIMAAALALMFAAADRLGDSFRATAAIRCTEDMPCWSWSTMGNHRRGIVSKFGNRRVVAPCQFARLAREGMIDWKSSGRMRGDGWAMRHGCIKAHFDALERSGR